MQVKRSLLAQLGALLMRPVLRELKQVVDVDGRGGAPLLGVDGVAIICHGRSSARAISRAIAVAEETETVEEVAEPFLVRLGFIMRTPRGRVATPAGWRHLGLQPPAQRSGSEQPDLFG